MSVDERHTAVSHREFAFGTITSRLDWDDSAAVEQFFRSRNWLRSGETVENVSRVGKTTHGVTLRVVTDQRTVLLKQARAQNANSGPDIHWNALVCEGLFYRRTARIPDVAARMPRTMAIDPEARLLVFEDLADARDCTNLYRGWSIHEREVRELANYLRALHDATSTDADTDLEERHVRAEHHNAVFVVPFAAVCTLDLDAFELWLPDKAAAMRTDTELRDRIESLGIDFLAGGNHLLHGDFGPENWWRTESGIRVFNPERCFYGPREWDLGVALAHLRLSAQSFDFAKLFFDVYHGSDTEPVFDIEDAASYAAVECIRRILGADQLPIPVSMGYRAELLDASRKMLLGGDLEDLWA